MPNPNLKLILTLQPQSLWSKEQNVFTSLDWSPLPWSKTQTGPHNIQPHRSKNTHRPTSGKTTYFGPHSLSLFLFIRLLLCLFISASLPLSVFLSLSHTRACCNPPVFARGGGLQVCQWFQACCSNAFRSSGISFLKLITQLVFWLVG